ncbi:MAG: ECF transporter S component, partial [Nitrososphaerota archaeon]
SISAALYAVAIAVTSPIPTPWGVGQFRPGVVFPAIFAIIYGPMIGGIGAAIGTFVGDVVFLTPQGLTTPLLSIVAGVPGNFAGFYLLGWFVRKHRSWFGFILGSFISLLVGNFIAAAGVVAYLIVFLDWSSLPADVLVGAVFGFTFFWLVTMIPFLIPLVPPLVVALRPLVGWTADMDFLGWERGTGSEALRSSLIVTAILSVLYTMVQFTPLGDILFKSVTGPQFIPWLKLLFLASAVVVFIFGITASYVLRRR